jgi:predicted acyltransferase (DUF342 family)
MSQFAINNSSLYANTLTSNVAFTAKGTATVTGLFTASGRAVVGTNLGVTGNTTITGLTTASGRLTVGTNLNVSGNSTIGGAGKTANVQGWFGVAGRATVSTNLFVGANTNIGGNLTAKQSAQQIVVSESTGSYASFLRRAPTGQPTYDFYQVNNTEVARITADINGWYVSTGSSAPIQFTVSSLGLVNIAKSVTVSNNLTVSGNSTINGTVSTSTANILQQTLSDAATVAWNTALGQIATVTIGGNRTMGAPTNLKVGTYILHIYQDGTGGRTMTWNALFKWTAGVAPPLSSAAGAHDVFSFVSDGTYLYGSFMPDVR